MLCSQVRSSKLFGFYADKLVDLALETINTCLSYLQVLSMHEIIKATDNPQDYDKAYAYLMCWGLFAGQTVECE